MESQSISPLTNFADLLFESPKDANPKDKDNVVDADFEDVKEEDKEKSA